jgi:hypothetical protein
MKLLAVIALTMLAATPAFAGKKKPVLEQPRGYHQQHFDWRASRNSYRGNYIDGPHVYSPSGRYIGSDPSPSVRQRMYDDDLFFRRAL